MQVNSKRHSSELIKQLGINGAPEITMDVYDKDKIEMFCNKYPEPVYILRDLDNPSGMFFVCRSKDECLENAKKYTGTFSLAVSCVSYEGKILLGEVMIKNNRIIIGARNDKESHHRNIYDNPIINLDTDWDDKRLWKVEGIELLFNYLVSKKLFDVIVEFVVYDHKVGTHNNEVLVVELRSNY